MEGRLLLKDCSMFHADGHLRRGVAVVVEGERITRVVDDALAPVLPGDWEVACRGRLVTPGLVDCHAHLVGDLLVPALGEVARTPADAYEVRRRREAALTAAEVEAITALALAEAARCGITFVVEHLRCPNDVQAALGAQAAAAERLGLRLSNSHATAGAPGAPSMRAQLDANAAYAADRRHSALVRPALGFHSSSTCDEELLRGLSRARQELRVGVHGHVYEGIRIVSLLEKLGLLGAGSIASCVRTPDASEAERLAETRTLVALSPAAVPAPERAADLEAVLSFEGFFALGSAGSGCLWSELEAALGVVMQLARSGRAPDPGAALARLAVAGPAELCSELYGAPSGTLEPGALADLVVHDRLPADEGASGPAHPSMLFRRPCAAWTVVNGRVVVREGQLLGADFLQLAAEAARALESVWRRAGP